MYCSVSLCVYVCVCGMCKSISYCEVTERIENTDIQRVYLVGFSLSWMKTPSAVPLPYALPSGGWVKMQREHCECGPAGLVVGASMDLEELE